MWLHYATRTIHSWQSGYRNIKHTEGWAKSLRLRSLETYLILWHSDGIIKAGGVQLKMNGFVDIIQSRAQSAVNAPRVTPTYKNAHVLRYQVQHRKWNSYSQKKRFHTVVQLSCLVKSFKPNLPEPNCCQWVYLATCFYNLWWIPHHTHLVNRQSWDEPNKFIQVLSASLLHWIQK